MRTPVSYTHLRATSLRILSESETPPFPIEEHIQTKDELRLKYRFLDLRRPNLQRNLMLRSLVATEVRAFLAEEGFLAVSYTHLICSAHYCRHCKRLLCGA